MSTSLSIRTLETAILGGGCFWCLEAVFLEVEGVHAVMSGYAGGQVANPSYEQVCGKRTGHVEVVRVEFDPVRISFTELLEIFSLFMTRRRRIARVLTQARNIGRSSMRPVRSSSNRRGR